MRRLFSVLSLVAFVVPANHALAQGGIRLAPFTASDALDVATWSVADLAADGRWLAATATTRRASLGVDFRRDGDPSYIRPASVRLYAIDTRSGDTTAVLPAAGNVRSVAWSPDGNTLAMLVLQGEHFAPHTWSRTSRKLTRLAVPAGSYVAENSELQWSGDGTRVFLALRSDKWLTRAGAEFDRMTRGPIFVQDAKDPFMAWDNLRRLGNIRSIASIDVATGKATTLVPEGMIGTWRVSEDDSVVSWSDDITKKTDYDVIFGSEQKLLARRLTGGDVMTVFPTLKGIALTWHDDGRRYAYSREGRVYVGQVGGAAPRQIAGPDSAARPNDADTTAAARTARAN
ncbi:MAG: hypothetical protein H7066_16445, partial [Cytophagaceae bacterium]|nr:hypothetical protein [Gemmatimonadaceae bacterium]